MKSTVLHIFRNSPLGRENLMQAGYFCAKQFGLRLAVYLPRTVRWEMELEGGRVPIELDSSYTQFPDTARAHAEEVLEESGCRYEFIESSNPDGGGVPLLPGDWAVMVCPRVISEQSSRIALGRLGAKVRSLVKQATFPVFIPSISYKPWQRVTAFFGGSELGAIAVKEALAIARLARVPFSLFTQLEGVTREACERVLGEAGILDAVSAPDVVWNAYDSGSIQENLYAVPSDSLVVVGAAGHHLVKELMFGSTLETVQSTLPNPLVVTGPQCRAPRELLMDDAS